MKKKEKKSDKGYKYVISDVEAAYKIFFNPDQNKREAINKRKNDNDGYCPNRPEKTDDTRCMCKQFRERDSEGFCKCRLYYKEARTKKQALAFQNYELEFNEKKERELEKQLEAEQKKKEKELEALNA